RLADDVLVRDDVAGGVVDEAGSLCALCLRAAEGVRAARRHGDLDHALVGPLVDVRHGELARAGGRARACDRDLADDRLRLARGETRVDGGAAAQADGEDGGYQEGATGEALHDSNGISGV